MSLQRTNGAIISLDHLHNDSINGILHAGGTIFREIQLEGMVPDFMRDIFPWHHGVPFSRSMDGSSDRSMAEVEGVGFYLISNEGYAAVHHGDLAKLDLTKSRDGSSPDAQAIHNCLSTVTTARLELPAEKVCAHDGKHDTPSTCKNIIAFNDFTKALIVDCFDGASVMQGEAKKGVACLVRQESAHSKTTWAAAHINQLVAQDGNAEDDYQPIFRGIVMEIAAHYNQSGKNQARINLLGDDYNGEHVGALGSLNDIRWAESMHRINANLFNQLPQVVMDLNQAAKLKFKSGDLTVMSGSDQFIGRAFFEKVDVGDGEMRNRKFKVESILPRLLGGM
jgi:hypothetical protein